MADRQSNIPASCCVRTVMATAIWLVLYGSLVTGCALSLGSRMQRWGDQGDVTALTGVLSHPEVRFRMNAVAMLGRTSCPEAIAPLLECIRNENEGIELRQYAAYELGYLGECGLIDRCTLELLTELALYGELRLRLSVVACLGRTGRREAIPPLVALLSGHEEIVTCAALDALGRLARERAFHNARGIDSSDVDAIRDAIHEIDGSTKSARINSICRSALSSCSEAYGVNKQANQAGVFARSKDTP